MSKAMMMQWAKILLGGLVGFGLMPETVMAAILENLEVALGAGLALLAVIEGWIRNLTNGPLSSWWGKK